MSEKKSSNFKKNIWGEVYSENKDSNGKIIGTTKLERDQITGEYFEQNYDSDGKAKSYSETKKNIWGQYKTVTKSGRKKTTSEHIVIWAMIIGIFYFVFKVVIPFMFATLGSLLFFIAIFNKSRRNVYLILSVVFSLYLVIDSYFKWYTSYLLTNDSYILPILYYLIIVSFFLIPLALLMFFQKSLVAKLVRFGIERKIYHLLVITLFILMFASGYLFLYEKFEVFKSIKGKNENNRDLIRDSIPFIKPKIQNIIEKEEVDSSIISRAIDSSKVPSEEEINNSDAGSLFLGKMYEGGIIIKLNENGEGGLLMSKNDLGDGNWDNAVQLCRDYSVNGYKNWRLPTLEELKLIYSNKELSNNFKENWYWSSTQDPNSSEMAYHLGFIYGDEQSVPKGHGKFVRAVRDF